MFQAKAQPPEREVAAPIITSTSHGSASGSRFEVDQEAEHWFLLDVCALNCQSKLQVGPMSDVFSENVHLNMCALNCQCQSKLQVGPM